MFGNGFGIGMTFTPQPLRLTPLVPEQGLFGSVAEGLGAACLGLPGLLIVGPILITFVRARWVLEWSEQARELGLKREMALSAVSS